LLTGTPLDLTPFGALLPALGLFYWAVIIGLAVVAYRWPKRRAVKFGASAAVLVLALTPTFNQYRAQSAAKARYQAAMAHFEMRCKSAGEKIVRTVENVEGVVWMKWRDKRDYRDDFDQFKLYDPFGRDCTEVECVEQLLRVTSGAEKNPEEAARRRIGYQFVESVDPGDGKPYRYVGVIKLPDAWTPEKIAQHGKTTGKEVPSFSYRFHAQREPLAALNVRYGITWDDISTREDREHWIAGGSLKVVDLKTNEVIAEQAGFLIDPGQGNTAGFRSPWGWARSYSKACPPLTSDHNTKFVFKVLQPSKQAE
jgi:hypothetical protein